MLAGRADLLSQGNLSSGLVQNLATHHPLQLHLDPQQATTYVFLNVARPPFDDVRVRRALNYAVDRARVAALHGVGLAQPTCQLVPPTDPGYRPYCPYTVAPDDSGDWKAPDLRKARALIRASGTQGQTIVVWSFSYFHRESEYLVSLLRSLGYRSRLHYVPDDSAYFPALQRTPTAQAGFVGWFDVPLAVDMLDEAGCHAPGPNWAHFCDPSIDAQLARLEREPPGPAGASTRHDDRPRDHQQGALGPGSSPHGSPTSPRHASATTKTTVASCYSTSSGSGSSRLKRFVLGSLIPVPRPCASSSARATRPVALRSAGCA